MPSDWERAVCARKQHYSAEHLAVTAVELLAWKFPQGKPLFVYCCPCCDGGWCLTRRLRRG